MGAWGRGFLGFGRLLVADRRMRMMVGLALAFSFVAVQVYANLVVTAIPTAILDLDQSRVSRALWSSMSAPREVAIAETPATIDEAWERLADGRLGAFVVIPAGLSEDLKKGREAAVLVAVDGANILVGRNAYKALAKAIGQVSAGVQVTTLRKQGARKDRSVAQAVPIAIDERPIRNPSCNYGVYVAPGILFFVFHVLVLLVGLSVFLPGNRPGDAMGVAGAMTAAFLACTGLGMVLAYAWLRPLSIVPASGPGWTLLFVACLVATDLLATVAVIGVLKSPLASVEVAIVVGMMSMMLSGITWPTDAFPPLLQAFSAYVPFTPFAKGMQVLLHSQSGFDELSRYLAMFARQGTLFAAVAAASFGLRRGVAASACRHARPGRPT